MKIRELFEKPIDRFIEGVIKADDDLNLIDEMDEYIITKDISKKLRPILENYSSNPKVNGVWISGFFGSGKSHLLKILSYVLENKEFDGQEIKIRDQSGNRTLVVFGDGDEIEVTSGEQGVRFLLVSGAPLREPVAWHGPIVMNTRAELQQAFRELNTGEFVKTGATGVFGS